MTTSPNSPRYIRALKRLETAVNGLRMAVAAEVGDGIDITRVVTAGWDALGEMVLAARWLHVDPQLGTRPVPVISLSDALAEAQSGLWGLIGAVGTHADATPEDFKHYERLSESGLRSLAVAIGAATERHPMSVGTAS